MHLKVRPRSQPRALLTRFIEAALKVSLTVEEKKGGPAKSSLAPPIQNEKIRSGSITKEGVRKGSGDGARASDNSSSHSDSDVRSQYCLTIRSLRIV